MATEQNESCCWLSDARISSFEDANTLKDDATDTLVEFAKHKDESFLRPGKSLEGFIIESRISHTEFFEIWKADHPHYGPSVIKTPYPCIVSDSKAGPKVRKIMLAESIALETIDHPNVVKLHERDIFNKSIPYLALEYVPGFSLSRLMPCPTDEESSEPDHQNFPLNYSQSIDIIISILDSLEHIHSKDILHLDLKPRNIIIRFDNGRPYPVILDFNACRLPDKFSWLGLDDSDVLFTLQYMAPEQPTFLISDLTCQTDLYPVAKMLNEMLTGKIMAPDQPLSRLEDKIGFYLSLSYNQSFPDSMDPLLEPHQKILSKSLLYNPGERHANAFAFRKDLEHVRSMLRVSEDRLLEQMMARVFDDSLMEGLIDDTDRMVSTTKRHRGQSPSYTSSFYKQDTESSNSDLLQLV